MYNEHQNKLMLEVVDLLDQAGALLQQAMGASDECYYIYSNIENSLEDVLDAIRENNPETIE